MKRARWIYDEGLFISKDGFPSHARHQKTGGLRQKEWMPYFLMSDLYPEDERNYYEKLETLDYTDIYFDRRIKFVTGNSWCVLE